MPMLMIFCAAVAGQLLVLVAGMSVRRYGASQRRVRPLCQPKLFDDKPPPAAAPLPAPLRYGLVYVRIPKTGSTSFAGVMRRIGYRHGLTHAHDANKWLLCKDKLKTEHWAPAVSTDHCRRVDISAVAAKRMAGSFYVTVVRNPAARCLSRFYYAAVTKKGMKPTTEGKIAFMRRWCAADSQLRYIQPALNSTVSAALASYGFVAVTERFDESLLILAKKFGVGLADILYLWGKKSGSSVEYATGRKLSYHPPLSKEPESVQQVARAIFGAGLDAQLVEAANLALDRARSDYGPSFREDLAKFQRMLAAVQAKCQSHYHGGGGCFYLDVGCGQPCIDSVLVDFERASGLPGDTCPPAQTLG